ASLDVLPAMIFHGGRVDMTLLAELNEVMRPLLFEMGRLAIERNGTARLPELKALRDTVADTTLDLEERARALRAVLLVLSDMTGNRVWQMLARRTHAFLTSEPLQAARGKLRPDPGRVVPAMDECIAALEAGRIEDAVAALQRVICTIEEN